MANNKGKTSAAYMSQRGEFRCPSCGHSIFTSRGKSANDKRRITCKGCGRSVTVLESDFLTMSKILKKGTQELAAAASKAPEKKVAVKVTKKIAAEETPFKRKVVPVVEEPIEDDDSDETEDLNNFDESSNDDDGDDGKLLQLYFNGDHIAPVKDTMTNSDSGWTLPEIKRFCTKFPQTSLKITDDRADVKLVGVTKG